MTSLKPQAFAVFFIVTTISGSSSIAGDQEKIASLVGKSLANRAALTNFSCTFSLETGESLADQCEIDKVNGTASGRWAKRGADELFQLDVGDIFELVPVGNGTDEVGWTAPFAGGRVVMRSSTAEMRLNTSMGSGAADAGARGYLHAEFCPFTSCQFLGGADKADPLMFLLENLDLPPPYGSKLTNGDSLSPTVDVLLGDISVSVQFDVAKNHLVTRCEFQAPAMTIVWRVTDSVASPEGSHFPTGICSKTYYAETSKKVVNTDFTWRASRLNFQTPSEDSLAFVAGTSVQLHGGELSKIIYLSPGERIVPADLNSIVKDIQRGSREDSLAKRVTNRNGVWFFLGSGLLLLIVFALFVRREKKLRV